jgi:hypothetical protein
MKTTSVCRCSPEASVAAPTSELGRRSNESVNRAGESPLTPCSPRDEHLALSATSSPASPNNDPLSKRIICQLGLPSSKTWEDIRGELLVKAVNKPMQPNKEALNEGVPLTPEAVDQPLAHLHRLAPELERRLHWKPPDHGGSKG